MKNSLLLFYTHMILPLAFIFTITGVIPRGQLSLLDIIHQYIQYDEMQEAINVLSSMNWNTMGQQCYISLSAIVNHLFRKKLTAEREG